MFAPLLAFSRHSVILASTGAAAQYSTRNEIVGIRGSRLGSGGTPSSPGVVERKVAHLRLGRRELRSYVYVRADQTKVQEAAYQDSRAGEPAAALRYSGSIGLRRAESAGLPLNVTSIERTAKEPTRSKLIVVQDGDIADALLLAAGMTSADARQAAKLLTGEGAGGPMSGGDMIEMTYADHASAKPAIVALMRTGRRLAAAGLDDAGDYASIEQVEPDPSPGGGVADSSRTSGASAMTVRRTLAVLAEQGRLDRGLVAQIVRVCSSGVDIDAPAAPSDAVSLLYSPSTSDGQPRPELAYVSIVAGGRRHRFYRFASDGQSMPDYVDERGQAASALLLRKPVAAGRLGDGFGWRIHPVLGDRRFHEEVDYAAPLGSPIVAAGAGIVEVIGQQWGYGRYIRIRHDQGYETTYAHVSGYPAGIGIGTRVRQGQPIAFIGSTGLSTGPHLYYEVRINGRDVDPLRVRLPAGPELDGFEMASFEKRRRRVDMLVQDAKVEAGLPVGPSSASP